MHIDWDLLTRYLAGACTDEERRQFEEWLAEAPKHRAVMQGARAMIEQGNREVPAERRTELLASLRRHIVAMESAEARPPTLRVVRGTSSPTIVLPLSTRRSRWTVPARVA